MYSICIQVDSDLTTTTTTTIIKTSKVLQISARYLLTLHKRSLLNSGTQLTLILLTDIMRLFEDQQTRDGSISE